MPVRVNTALGKLRAGETIYTSSVRLPEPGLCELLGYAGFDCVLIDGEHGCGDAASIDRMVQGCLAGGSTPLVRVLKPNDPEVVMLSLDLGIQGVLIPHCRTAADALALKQAAHYPPRGKRGIGPGRGAQWGRVPQAEYLATAGDQVMLLALIEDAVAVDNIEDIAAVGLDVLWVGTSDLAADYGLTGQTSHPRVIEAALRIAKACERHGIAAGFPARDPESAKWARANGFRAIGFGCAEQYVMTQARQFLEPLGR